MKEIARTDSGSDLLTIDPKRIKEIVATLPTRKRAAMSKALKAACQHLRDSRANYNQAFDLASAMVENWWHLGNELAKLRQESLLYLGAASPKSDSPPGDRVTLREIGATKNQSSRCQRLAEMEKSELVAWLKRQYDESKYTLPALRGAATRARQQKTKSDKSRKNARRTKLRYPSS